MLSLRTVLCQLNQTLTCDSHDVHNVIAEAIKQHEDLTGIPYEAQAVTPAYTPNSTSAGKENGTYTY